MVAAVIGQCLIFVHVILCSLYQCLDISMTTVVILSPQTFMLPWDTHWNDSRTYAHNLPLPCEGHHWTRGKELQFTGPVARLDTHVYTKYPFSNVIPIWECSMCTAWYCNWSSLHQKVLLANMFTCTVQLWLTVQ